MPLLDLPRTAACIVCGPSNPHGLHLTSAVDPGSADVHSTYTPRPEHVGFDALVHGGILSTVADEVMVWAAIWVSRRACVAGELSVRFRHPVAPGDRLAVVARVNRSRGRMHEAEGTLADASGRVVVSATGKYLSGSAADTAAFLATLVPEAASAAAVAHLRG